MVDSSLQDDLLGIPGVEGAEVDGSNDAPAGLRIRIAQDADQEAVGGAIRRVLGAHGLGTDTQLPGESAEVSVGRDEGPVAVLTADEPSPVTDPQPDEGRAVIDLTDKEPAPAVTDATNIDESSDRLEAAMAPGSWEADHVPPFVEPRREAESQETTVDSSGQPSNGRVARIDSVAVVEARAGIIVTVSASDGTEASEAASSTEGGVEKAVVKATARLVDLASPDPIIVEIEDRRVDGVDIVMIVLDADGTLVTGSAVVAAGRPFALGRATWAALAL